LYREALESDLVDIQGGTTGEGIHCGVMGGTVVDALVAFAGLDLSGDVPVLDPKLPEGWKKMTFSFSFRGERFRVVLSPSDIKIIVEGSEKDKIKLQLCGRDQELEPGQEWRTNYR